MAERKETTFRLVVVIGSREKRRKGRRERREDH